MASCLLRLVCISAALSLCFCNNWNHQPQARQYQQSQPCPKKQIVYNILKSLETGDVGASSHINSNKYIQHNLGSPDGVAAFRGLVAMLNGTARANPVRIFQDGDFVFAHTEYFLPIFGGNLVGFDIFRFENGLIVEHWDNLQAKSPTPNPSGHIQTDGPTHAMNWDQTSQNRALVRQFMQNVFIGGNFNQMSSFFNGDNYIQHNTLLGDGVSGVIQGTKTLSAAGKTMAISTLHLALAEGNFVLLTSEGTFGTNLTAYYDLFRVENGKIAEHWDVLQTIPPRSEWKNNNGKF